MKNCTTACLTSMLHMCMGPDFTVRLITRPGLRKVLTRNLGYYRLMQSGTISLGQVSGLGKQYPLEPTVFFLRNP
uniref:Uncharacterized protein n=1 Tax=Romanomermis culicivorax TaxID=13658 RepID=A0A915HYA1_ROMCU